MRKVFYCVPTVLGLMFLGAAGAQSLEGIPAGLIKNGDRYILANPRTAVLVTVTLQKESVRKGPYARFSQKYLGVIAPLNDRDTYWAAGASVGYVDMQESVITAAPGAPKGEARSTFERISLLDSDTSFVRLPLNLSSAAAKSVEEMAAEAAAAIFGIRKHRSELISGEAGEHVFGAGLAAALEELRRQEEGYLELFLGKQFVMHVTRTFEVVPESDRFSYVVCHLSESGGFVDASLGGGRPVALEFLVERQEISVKPLPKKPTEVVTLLFPAVAACRLLDGGHELASGRGPVCQFGTKIDMVVKSNEKLDYSKLAHEVADALRAIK